MKTKIFKKKLSLRKSTISNLSNGDMKKAIGGTSIITCDLTCPMYCSVQTTAIECTTRFYSDPILDTCN